MQTLHDKDTRFFGLDVNSRWTPWILLGLVSSLWFLCWILCTIFIGGCQAEEIRGQFGDMFGAVNAFFSGLAFAGIIMTILLQREELRAQREELRQNTAALNAQKEEFTQQNKTILKQSFESTFYNNLNGKDTIVSMLNQDDPENRYFEHMYRKLHDVYKAKDDAEPTLKPLREFYYNNEWHFGHYFRNVVITLKLIDGSELGDDQNTFYVSVLQARMSNDELRMLLYFVIYELGNNEDYPDTITYGERLALQVLMKKYDFFAVVRTRLAVNLINSEHDWEIFRRLVYEPLEDFDK